MKDIKKVFEWAKVNGDAKIIDRILVGLLPELLKNNMKSTSKDIENSKTIDVSDELYNIIKTKSEELVGSSFDN
ncbi:MAG: hypothetical protein GQ570_05240 [Helicobacteraceae bacterium]|nr:hypothetical protein [Helicobacteraceae bacterium]